jgi:uncharacterized protein (UPF0335 family)
MSDEAENPRAVIGDNGAINREAQLRLTSIVDRIERLEEEKKGISDDIKDVKAEAKGAGFDVAAINAILKMRKKEANEIVEQTMVVETYCRALNMSSYLE